MVGFLSFESLVCFRNSCHSLHCCFCYFSSCDLTALTNNARASAEIRIGHLWWACSKLSGGLQWRAEEKNIQPRANNGGVGIGSRNSIWQFTWRVCQNQVWKESFKNCRAMAVTHAAANALTAALLHSFGKFDGFWRFWFHCYISRERKFSLE